MESEADTSNFDPVFTGAMPVDSLPNQSAPLSDTLQQNFVGFTYTDEQLAASQSSRTPGRLGEGFKKVDDRPATEDVKMEER